MKRKLLSFIFMVLLLITSSPLVGFAESKSMIALGSSLSDYQKEEILSIFGDENSQDFLTIDGNKVNEYLNDGTDNSVGIFSSAKVTFHESGYGVNVYILTPENITKVTESVYKNAAIVAGASNVDIEIAAPSQVTGEGALAGVYEIFSKNGLALDSNSIQIAEKQIQVEQFLSENTNLNPSQISRLITEFNLNIINQLEDSDDISESDLRSLLEDILSKNNFDISEEAINQLIKHGSDFAKSDSAKDKATKEALEAAMASYEDLDDVFNNEVVVDNGSFKINEVRILNPGEGANYFDKPLLGIWYSFTLNDDEEPTPVDMVWMDHVEVIQDNDPNTINELLMDACPDEEFYESYAVQIKPGGTAENAVGFALDEDLTTPIQLKFYKNNRYDPDSKLAKELILNISGLN